MQVALSDLTDYVSMTMLRIEPVGLFIFRQSVRPFATLLKGLAQRVMVFRFFRPYSHRGVKVLPRGGEIALLQVYQAQLIVCVGILRFRRQGVEMLLEGALGFAAGKVPTDPLKSKVSEQEQHQQREAATNDIKTAYTGNVNHESAKTPTACARDR